MDDNPPEGAFEWKINRKHILFRGTGFESRKSVYRGKVVTFEDFFKI